MKLTIRRLTRHGGGIYGQMEIDGQLRFLTLENEAKAIPNGWYRVQVNRSPKFGRPLPQLLYVPDPDGIGGNASGMREGIRIHRGNLPKDSAGCILVGSLPAESSEGTPLPSPPALIYSAQAEASLTQQLTNAQQSGESLWVEVCWQKTDTERLSEYSYGGAGSRGPYKSY